MSEEQPTKKIFRVLQLAAARNRTVSILAGQSNDAVRQFTAGFNMFGKVRQISAGGPPVMAGRQSGKLVVEHKENV